MPNDTRGVSGAKTMLDLSLDIKPLALTETRMTTEKRKACVYGAERNDLPLAVDWLLMIGFAFRVLHLILLPYHEWNTVSLGAFGWLTRLFQILVLVSAAVPLAAFVSGHLNAVRKAIARVSALVGHAVILSLVAAALVVPEAIISRIYWTFLGSLFMGCYFTVIVGMTCFPEIAALRALLPYPPHSLDK